MTHNLEYSFSQTRCVGRGGGVIYDTIPHPFTFTPGKVFLLVIDSRWYRQRITKIMITFGRWQELPKILLDVADQKLRLDNLLEQNFTNSNIRFTIINSLNVGKYRGHRTLSKSFNVFHLWNVDCRPLSTIRRHLLTLNSSTEMLTPTPCLVIMTKARIVTVMFLHRVTRHLEVPIITNLSTPLKPFLNNNISVRIFLSVDSRSLVVHAGTQLPANSPDVFCSHRNMNSKLTTCFVPHVLQTP